MLTQLYVRGRVFLVLTLFAVLGATCLWGQAVTTNAQGLDKIRMSVDAHAACYRMPQLPAVHIGSDRVSGRDVFGVA
jgi:hypothetical protein